MLRDEVRAPFDVSIGPLIRARLLQLDMIATFSLSVCTRSSATAHRVIFY